MKPKSQYVDFDGEVRIVGTQEKRSPAEEEAITKKIGEYIRRYKAAEAAKSKQRTKKAS